MIAQRTTDPLVAVFSTHLEARNAIDNLSYFIGKSAVRAIHYLPNYDFDFNRGILPNPEVIFERNVALFHAIRDPAKRIFVTTIGALIQKAMPPESFCMGTVDLQTNQAVEREQLMVQLGEAGYQRQPVAYDPGFYSVRGAVVDIFCPLYNRPVRLEFFGDEIEEIRFFDSQSQRSLEKLEAVSIIPVGISLSPTGEALALASRKGKERLDHLDIPKGNRDEILEKIANGQLSGQLAFLFPLLSGGTSSITEYFQKEPVFLWDGREKIREAAEKTEIPRLLKNHDLFEKDLSPIAEASELFAGSTDVVQWLNLEKSYSFESFATVSDSSHRALAAEPLAFSRERLAAQGSSSHLPLEGFVARFKEWMDQGYRIHLVCHTQTHAERFQLLLEPYGIRCQFHPENEPVLPELWQCNFQVIQVWLGLVTQSLIFPTLRVVCLSEEEVFGHKKRISKSSQWSAISSPSRVLSSLRDLKAGDLIVHRDHGIGRYLGLRSMNFQGITNDFVVLEYKDGDKLYLPVYRLNVIQKYAGGEQGGPALDKLGGERWAKAKKKAEKAAQELAAEFLNIQARRKLLPAFACSGEQTEFRQFEMEFPFDETPDQLRAIEEVMVDLSQPHPMDRLICGDVGYGKTEVAMRAAYRCALDGKQVAILVPTTVLAFQHFETFKTRFSGTAVRVDMVSRLRSSREIKATLAGVKEGKIDVVIGTHRLLSNDVQFKDLALIVVDEEHRFGVVHKEKLKRLFSTVHAISMTATPIPRTLNMAMTGIKDVSIITTPPPDRLAVRTFVCRRSSEVIVEAITQELNRKGQIFFVHNRVESIQGIAEELLKLFPKLKLEVVHGQMESDKLEHRMLSFYRGEFPLLLTTAIIESGLDIPTANTIIIDGAHTLGLAQLYQLRGRVGRSDRRAYCYLLCPPENQMTDESKQRLQVIQRYADLGSGFNVASHDLEIRGAGDLLGKEQSGHLNAVGVDLYFELLEESIRVLRGQEKPIDIEPEINLRIPAYFPDEYLPDISERISIYRRLSSVENEDAISDIEVEIRDRFGALPPEVVNLLGLMRIKLYLKKLHVVRMSCGPKRTSLQFAPTTPASPQKLVDLIQRDRARYQLTPDQKLVFTVADTDWPALLKEVQRLCLKLGHVND
ncbi:MAG: transcription-repair coupling factor [Deltaproteobacteria bacterium]|nr:transcription-repair coupling factor [Deltaproteobacteria bacterium]